MDRRCNSLDFEIGGDAYLQILEASKGFWANGKTDVWGRGHIKRPALIGLLGEAAFGAFTGLKVNMERKIGGEKCDFQVGDFLVDVKTASKIKGFGLVRRENDYGKAVPLLSNIYVFAEIADHSFGKSATVRLIGWQTRRQILKAPLTQGIRGKPHKNAQIDKANMMPMSWLPL